MGVVYQGKHVVVGRKVAIKFLNSEFSTQEDIVTRFYREAQNAAAIGHKNIVDILDVGISERNEPYIVMEYLEGECLSALLRRCGRISLGAASGILEPVLLAIHAAHRKGIVHRDLKPENIFLVHDSVDDSISIKLIDFGIAKLIHVSETDNLTRPGSALGTPCYMSPEQVASAKDIDSRSDIYAIGVILFEMLTGRPPFEGENHQKTMLQILTEEPPDPRDVYDGFPEVALPIVTRAMKRNPNERYQDAAAMLDAVAQLAAFQHRNATLSALALDLDTRECATGDLGRKIDVSETTDVPARVFTNLSIAKQPHTPASWSESKSKATWFPKPSNRSAMILVTLTILLTLAAVFFIISRSKSNSLENSVVQIPAVSANQSIEDIDKQKTPVAVKKEVRIIITGAPPRSTIMFGEVIVPSNNFFVPIGEHPVPLTVEAPGFESFNTEITPNRDVTISVEMPRATSRKKVQKRRKRVRTRGKDSKYVEGRRNTEIVKDFE